MKFYYVDGEHWTTLKEAKQAARRLASESYHDVKVNQIEIATTKENILRLLNDAGGTHTTIAEAIFVAKAKLKKED